MTALRVVDPISVYKDGVLIGTPENINFIGSNFSLSLVGNTLNVSACTVITEPKWNEVPVGTIDSMNMTFSISTIPLNKKIMLFLNGQLLEEGIDNDYILTTNSINLMTAPQIGDKLIASYLKTIDSNLYCWSEIPSGLINNSNVTFNLVYTPRANTLMLFLNGRLLEEGIGKDYILTLNEITLDVLFTPIVGDKLIVSYIRSINILSTPFSEIPSGVVDETNKDFYLSHTPVEGTFLLFFNGRLLESGVSSDYTRTGNHIILSSNFDTVYGDKINARAYYEYI